ncbi:fused MFS/spermidine synthase [Edaphobacter albus]|uniref:fused MFS/spermidine synthase n=1 Tax=Edaphobacter sp. 4G125 TaxID=2763071 RepID=UPI001644E467|nr:fused MFS/spermidine synthase [Edaphobacter sp. 4G125]QNI36620.1 fused MFS/spermidine synthase [Edaphobacter sp. 4G125]
MPSTRLLYGTTAFLSAFLLFLVEPLAAKQLLPVLGGSSAVWLTCLVFFQTTLLLGYLYAHWLSPQSFAFQRRIHLAVVSLATAVLVFSLAFQHSGGASDHPISTIFWTLSRTIGLPFLLLASTSPLLQTWLSQREADESGRPAPVWFRLFALSNTGSLLALFAYPTIVEPYLSLRHQRFLWTIGFLLFALLAYLITSHNKDLSSRPETAQRDPLQSVISTEGGVATEVEKSASLPPSSNTTRWLWFLLPMAAAMQLSAVTAHLTVDIAAIPLLWILPLAVYLITFILAFDRPALYRRPLIVRVLVVMLASLGYALSKTDFSLPITLTILFFLVECFVACLFCHGETYARRPQRSSEVTLFYLFIAAGGATGTFLVGIAFPLLFSANYDLALAFFTTALLAVAATWRDGWTQRMLWATASILLFVLALALHRAYGRQSLVQVRNFYGSLRVTQTDAPVVHTPMRTLLHGAIQHGTQIFNPGYSHIPTTYYAPDSGIGLALRFCCNARPKNIGVIGLGAGTLAAYGQRGDHIRFYEINPNVEPIARNLFTYIRDTFASVTVVPGDARTSLATELASGSPQRFDVLAVDAFSGDAIPLHLLTREALQLYLSHLAPNGILAFHVSNQYLDLAPELALLANSAHLEARDVITSSAEARGEFRAEWILMTADPTFFTQPELTGFADPIYIKPGLRLWTDDYSSLLPIFQPSGH